jgi:hypothetical protein
VLGAETNTRAEDLDRHRPAPDIFLTRQQQTTPHHTYHTPGVKPNNRQRQNRRHGFEHHHNTVQIMSTEVQPLSPPKPEVKTADKPLLQTPNQLDTIKNRHKQRTENRQLSILKAAGIESVKQNLIQRLFPPGKKATGVRRYLFSLILLFLIDCFIWSVFFGLYNTNITPVLGLDQAGTYVPRQCHTVSSSIEKSNNIFYDVWRSELTIEYNLTSKAGGVQQAKIYDSVTGIFGRESIAVDFLHQFYVGKVFECHVKVSNRYFAAVKPENVYTNVVLSLVVLGIFGVVFFVAMFRAVASFIRFRRDFIWDPNREAWIVKHSRSLDGF